MKELARTNSYGSLREFVVSNRLMLPKPADDWRLLKDQPIGSINGLPGIVGPAVATNGILVAIERSDRTIMFCHLEWFIPMKNEGEIKVLKQSTRAKLGIAKENSFSDSLIDFGK